MSSIAIATKKRKSFGFSVQEIRSPYPEFSSVNLTRMGKHAGPLEALGVTRPKVVVLARKRWQEPKNDLPASMYPKSVPDTSSAPSF
jgi:hypothetical protein